MNNLIKSILALISCLVIGLVAIALFQQLQFPVWLNASIVLLVFFIIINIAYCRILKLKEEVRKFWSLKKLLLLPLGMAGGAVIALSPMCMALITGQLSASEITFNWSLSVSSIALTLVVVAWEELWFRGIFLNYCHRSISSVILSLSVGFLFMLVHLLNPDIDLLKTGPTLFFAGALLTMLYFYFESIWLPIGLHFGNNYINAIMDTPLKSDVLFGGERYISTFFLALLFILFAMKSITKDKLRH